MKTATLLLCERFRYLSVFVTCLKDVLDIFFYCTLLIHIHKKMIIRNSVFSVLFVSWQYFLSFP